MTVLETKRLPSLGDPVAKLGHARRHLDALDAACKAYIEDPDSFGSDAVPQEGGGFIFRSWQRKPPPLLIALICGDTVHNIRTALDYLIRQLGIADSQKVTDKSEFPFVQDAGEGEHRWLSAVGQKLSLLSEPHVAEIRNLQPFIDKSDDSPNVILDVLNWLERIDKHNLPVIVSAAATNAKVEASGVFRKIQVRPLGKPPIVIGEEPVGLYWMNAWGPSNKVDVNQLTGMTLRFGSAEGPNPVMLRRMSETVGAVIGRFAVDILAAAKRLQENG